MGVAEVTCTTGCKCQRVRMDATWLHKLSVLVFHDLLVSSGGLMEAQMEAAGLHLFAAGVS